MTHRKANSLMDVTQETYQLAESLVLNVTEIQNKIYGKAEFYNPLYFPALKKCYLWNCPIPILKNSK